MPEIYAAIYYPITATTLLTNKSISFFIDLKFYKIFFGQFKKCI